MEFAQGLPAEEINAILLRAKELSLSGEDESAYRLARVLRASG